MMIQFTLNGRARELDCAPGESLMAVLRRAGLWSVKHGCETGECGVCSVLLDGKLTPTCVLLAAQAAGRSLVTVESLGPGQTLHPLQQAFVDSGAIQCGYCTPAMLLAAHELLQRSPRPDEAEVREALSGFISQHPARRRLAVAKR